MKDTLTIVKEQIAALTDRDATDIRDDERLCDFGRAGAMVVALFQVKPVAFMTVADLVRAIDATTQQ